MQNKSVLSMGNAELALRLVIGWTYFSAFWRRLILENKLDPEAAGYIGEKFNHFLPNALFIKPLIQYLVENPEALLWNMWIFTIVEGVVGLLLMLGYKTRIMSIAVFFLATVRRGPFLVLAFLLELCPLTGRFFLWRTPR